MSETYTDAKLDLSLLHNKGANFALAYRLVKAYAGSCQKVGDTAEFGNLLETTLKKINELAPEPTQPQS